MYVDHTFRLLLSLFVEWKLWTVQRNHFTFWLALYLAGKKVKVADENERVFTSVTIFVFIAAALVIQTVLFTVLRSHPQHQVFQSAHKLQQ